MEAKDILELQALSPFDFENLVRDVFVSLGYEVQLTRRSGDEGVDLRLSKSGEQSIAQCKRYRGQVGPAAVRDFYGTVVHTRAKKGYLVTTGTFSLASEAWAVGKNLVLVDGTDLVGSIDALGIEVASPTLETKDSPLSRLFQALEHAAGQNSVDRRECLYAAFLGPPPKPHTYRELSDALRSALGIEDCDTRYFEADEIVGALMSRNDDLDSKFWFFEGDDFLPDGFEWVNIAKFGGELRWKEKQEADVHIAIGLWNPRQLLKWMSEPDSRFKRELEHDLNRAGYVEVDAKLLDWNNLVPQLTDGLAAARLDRERQGKD